MADSAAARRAILDLLAQRDAGKTICPSEAARALEVDWQTPPSGRVDSATVMQQLAQAAQAAHDSGGGFAFRREGDVKAGLQSAARQVSAVYSAPYLAHVTMEPMNCTVQVRDGAATVWAPTQVPGAAREAAARVLGLPDEAVTVHVTYLGGGFGLH